tara:strand:+ start:1188 stop:2078 length:891 start_codon:yes stop_codon:yes gene_type:complete
MDESKLFYLELKGLRESSEISLEEISDFTKIDIKYLMAIEEGDFSSLPNVYMRLFLRSYCDYIKADSIKALNDYELHTIGSISSDNITPINNIQDQEIESDMLVDQETLNTPPVTKSQIVTIAATIIVLILVFYLISSITGPDDNNLGDGRNNAQETIVKPQPDSVLVDNQYYNPIPNQNLLTNREFESNLLSSKSDFLNTEFPPYIFTIKALSQTKINIDNDGQIINRIIDAGQHISFEVQSVIKFDLWSASHVDCKLNDIDLSILFGKKEQSIRGSFEAEDQRLYYQVHSQFQY